jgi:hypothetical protein
MPTYLPVIEDGFCNNIWLGNSEFMRCGIGNYGYQILIFWSSGKGLHTKPTPPAWVEGRLRMSLSSHGS